MSVYKNGIKKDVERIAAAIQVRDSFATPAEISYLPTDPSQLLFDDRKRHMLSHFLGSKTDKLSDYELFYEFISNLESVQGSAEKEIFVEELKILYGDEILGAINDPRLAWQNICDKMSLGKYNYAEKIKTMSSNNLTNYVRIFSNIDNFQNYYDFLSYQTEEIKKSDSEYIVADISVLNFARTDDFHAAEAYKRYVAKDTKFRDVALSGALYPVMSAIKSAGKTLLLNIEDNYSSAERIIEYFSAREVLPNTVIFAREHSRRVAERLCGAYKSGKGEIFVRFGLLFYEGDTVRDIKARVLDASAVYPVGKLFVGGALTSSPLLPARHNILKRGIAEALYELSCDLDWCLRITENIVK